MKSRINNCDDTLFLIIIDECHYGTIKSSDAKADITGAVDRFVNSDDVRGKTNVIRLFVSATPYCLQTSCSQIPLDNEVYLAPMETYYGHQKYIDTTKKLVGTAKTLEEQNADLFRRARVVSGEQEIGDWLNAQTKISSGFTWESGGGFITCDDGFELSVSGKDRSLRGKQLIGDYITALEIEYGMLDPKERHASPFTRRMVHDLLHANVVDDEHGGRAIKGCMIPFRTSYGESEKAEIYADAIRKFQSKHGLVHRFSVITDIDQRKSSFGNKISSEMKRRFPERDYDKYEDLADIPCILILCDKEKMGDTFPQSLRYYDLRLRYNSKTTLNRAPVEQDLGRAFGYRAGDIEIYPLPVIVIGRGKYSKTLTGEAGTSMFGLPPDNKMKPVHKSKPGCDETSSPREVS